MLPPCASFTRNSALLPALVLLPLISGFASEIILQALPPPTSLTMPSKDGLVSSAPGPWGRIDYYPIYLEAPDYLVEKFPLPSSKPKWLFPVAMTPGLEAFFQKAGLDKNTVATLMRPDSTVQDAEWTSIYPPVTVVEALTPSQRQAIYIELGKYQANEYNFEPVHIINNDVDSWFRNSGLRPELVAKIKSMAYMRGEGLVFSDIAVLMNYVQGEAEGRKLLKELTQTRSYIARLNVDASSDLDQVVSYWTTGLNLRRKDLLALLESQRSVPGAGGLDIAHLLPALPRKLLMTYPDMAMAREGIMPDCHWTSLNFFNYDAQPYLLDSRLATSAVLERFSPVAPPYKFGDIMFFVDSTDGDAYHSCVYLADDLVFTKNGRNVLSPWVIMRLDEIKRVYMRNSTDKLQGYRNKVALKKATESGE